MPLRQHFHGNLSRFPDYVLIGFGEASVNGPYRIYLSCFKMHKIIQETNKRIPNLNHILPPETRLIELKQKITLKLFIYLFIYSSLPS